MFSRKLVADASSCAQRTRTQEHGAPGELLRNAETFAKHQPSAPLFVFVAHKNMARSTDYFGLFQAPIYITGYHVSCRLVDMRRRNAPHSSWPGCDGAHVTASLLHGATVQSATITTCSGWQGTVSAEGSGYMYSNLPGRSYQAPDLHRTRNEAIMTSRDYLISS